MIELGKQRTVAVKTRKMVNGKMRFVPAFGPDSQPLTKLVQAEVIRVTRGVLSGSFGKHKRRKLVVRLLAGDVLTLAPARSRLKLSASLFDIYGWMVRSQALKLQLEKARIKKARLADQRITRRLDAAERRLRERIKNEEN